MRRFSFIVLVVACVFQGTSFSESAVREPRGCLARLKWFGLYSSLAVSAIAGSGFVAEHANKQSDRAENSDFENAPQDRRLDIAILGDSLSSGYPTSETPGVLAYILESRWTRQGGWALDLDPGEGSVESLYERISRRWPTKLTVYARSGAYVDGASPLDRTAANLARNITNFSGQVDRAIAQKELPNLVLMWIGHNNMDWVYDLKEVPSLGEEHYEKIPKLVADEYRRQLQRLVDEANRRRQKMEIIVFGLVNFADAFEARKKAAEIRAADPSKFQGFETVYQAWPSIEPKYQEKTVALVERTNEALEKMVGEFSSQSDEASGGRVNVRFSAVLHDVDVSDPKDLHPLDGFHPSRQAHGKFSNAVEAEVEKSAPRVAR